jgi:hypothetical protein
VPIPIPGRVSRSPTVERSISIPSALRGHSRSRRASGHHGGSNGSDGIGNLKEAMQENEMDLTDLLQHSEQSVVKTRTGSVLSRGFILKTDHYPSGVSTRVSHLMITLMKSEFPCTGRALDLDLNVHGAPNFRAPRVRDFNVFGAAQPRTQGLRAILSILRCRPGTPNPSHVVWFSTREEPIGEFLGRSPQPPLSVLSLLMSLLFLSVLVYISGRPFVLRDASEPRRTLSLSDRAENLEAIEIRMKNDILQEAARCVFYSVLMKAFVRVKQHVDVH